MRSFGWLACAHAPLVVADDKAAARAEDLADLAKVENCVSGESRVGRKSTERSAKNDGRTFERL